MDQYRFHNELNSGVTDKSLHIYQKCDTNHTNVAICIIDKLSDKKLILNCLYLYLRNVQEEH